MVNLLPVVRSQTNHPGDCQTKLLGVVSHRLVACPWDGDLPGRNLKSPAAQSGTLCGGCRIVAIKETNAYDEVKSDA